MSSEGAETTKSIHPIRAPRRRVESNAWVRPDVSALTLEYRVTSSFVEDFAAGHTPADVLRELVQNEYDAGGASINIEFGDGALRVTGSGKPIDAVGWKRLSVMMGTGSVAGSDDEIEEKVNDLGSKNFGIRSLFLFGDRIFIHSHGRMTVLDVSAGALSQPIPDAGSRRSAGVRIEVPYRTQATKRLEPFTEEREVQAFDDIFEELAPTLVKLALPGARKDLRSLTISSQRLGRTIQWRQRVKEEKTKLPGFRILRRSATLEERSSIADGAPALRSTRIEELEFQKRVALPADHRGRAFPGYFRLSGGKVRVAVSVRTHRNRIALEHPGCHYYPLGALKDLTGMAVSVSAPFLMDADRSRVTENEWNQWLLERSADAVIELLGGDWLARFEGDAYLALKAGGETRFSKLIDERLRTHACWPTRARTGKRKPAPVLRPVKELVTDRLGDLGGFVPEEKVLDDRMRSGPALRHMAEVCGAKMFGLSSLVRLRCAGDDATSLSDFFKPARDANYRYTNLPSALQDVETQRKLAAALDAHCDELSDAHRKALKLSPTTLTAANTLAAPGNPTAPLWAVDPALSHVCHVPEDQRLHPELFEFKAIRQLCRPFKVTEWVHDVARRISERKAKESEREALYRYVLSRLARLDRKMQQMLHRCPMLRDHRGAWVAPAAITLRGVSGAAALEPVLSFPHEDYAGNGKLARSLRFRSKVQGDDFVRYADVVARQPALAEAFETILHRRISSLSQADVDRLKAIPFLRSSRETLARPTEIFVPTLFNQACLGPDAPYTTANHPALYERLGCRRLPTTTHILAHLRQLREKKEPPPRLEVLYPALVEALGRERVAKTTYADEPILWTHLGYRRPADTVLRPHRDLLPAAVPRSPTHHQVIIGAYGHLGASLSARPEHWGLVLVYLSNKHKQTSRPLSPSEQNAVRAAYEHLSKIPDNVPVSARCFLDSDGLLHSAEDVRANRYLIDDDPPLARAVIEQGAEVRFADPSERTLRFLIGLRVGRLTQLRQVVGYDVGEERPLPKELVSARLLEVLHSANFASALSALVFQRRSVEHLVSRSTLQEKLRSYHSVVSFTSLRVLYDVAGVRVTVPVEAALDAGRVLLTDVRRTYQAFAPLAQPIAALAGGTIAEQRDLADAIYRLLTDPSPTRMKAYLEGRGVRWSPMDDTDPSDEDEDTPDAGAAIEERELTKSAISEALLGTLGNAAPNDGAADDTGDESDAAHEDQASTGAGTDEEPVSVPTKHDLPELDDVIVELVDSSEGWTPPPPKGGRGGKGGGSFDPTTKDAERDHQIGRRGEELVYRDQIERVRLLGYSDPEACVSWTSDKNSTADHDIRSINENGEPIWIEVKSTPGCDGRFYWGKAEFELALKMRSHYVLCRVYKADTTHPVVKYLPDPVGMLERQALRLEIGTLRAEVEPLDV